MRASICCLVFLIASCAPPLQHDGWEVGSGGGQCKAEWIDAINEARAIVAEGAHPRITSRDLESAFARTAIVYKSRVTLDGSEVDAVNFARANPPRIEVGCDRLLQMSTSARTELAIHEMASILGLDDSRNEVSRALDIARVCRRAPPVRAAIERETGKACNVIRPRELALVSELRLRLKHLTAVEPADFAGLSGLRRLDISYNEIKTLPPAVFAELPALKFLDLRGNTIASIPTGLFAGSPLDEVSGDSKRDASAYWDNPIERIETGFLGPDSKAEYVTLCPRPDWFIREIADGAFDGLRENAQVTLCLAPSAKLALAAFRGLEKAGRLQFVGAGFDHFPRGFFGRAQAKALDFSGDDDLPKDILAEMNVNRDLVVVRFYRNSREQYLPDFNCQELKPHGREQAFLRIENPRVCYRKR